MSDTIVQDPCIAAIATAVGGAISIVRLSGAGVLSVADRCWKSLKGRGLSELSPRMFTLGAFEELDPQCLAVWMKAPHSYTGEDVVEFHCHGGALCVRQILERLLRNGARMAEPGEFTRRAFLNGKMDLTQAEAVMEMITARSSGALRLAGRQLNGAIGDKVRQLQASLDDLRAEVESRLDFPEEELDFRAPEVLARQAAQVREELLRLAATRHAGELIRGGVPVVLAGAPNAGKSSLLNALLGRERSIVSDIPGTTRDTVEETIQLQGMPFRLTDTAGIRQQGADQIEEAGMARAERAAEESALVLWIFDATENEAVQPNLPNWKYGGAVLRVANKCDLLTAVKRRTLPGDAIQISAQSGEGLEALATAMVAAVAGKQLGEMGNEEMAVSSRHGALFEEAAAVLADLAPLLLSEQWELAATLLRGAIHFLGEVTGKYALPDVLDTIFHRFCIGK